MDRKQSARAGRTRAGGKVKLTLVLLPFGDASRHGLLSRLGLGQPLLELIYPTSGINELLSAGIERVTSVADADQDSLPGGAGFDDVPAGTPNFRILIFRMNVSSHN
jgi:hypothetical protein